MITFSKFGTHGNLGNQLFQYATLIGFSKKYNQQLVLPNWKYSANFKNLPNSSNLIRSNIIVREPYFHFTPDFWDKNIGHLQNNVNVDIIGWLQSEKYWSHCVEEVKSALEFEPEFKINLRHKYNEQFSKPTIAISIRRGDYVDNPNYELLPIHYYIQALYENFTEVENYNIIIFSDDIPYCKLHLAGLENVYFAEGEGPIEQLCLMSFCDNFIIANSTFSWWGAYLGEKEGSRIIRPNYLFNGPLLRSSDSKDFYPERWLVYDHKENNVVKKFDLSDVTFTIPTFHDHRDRFENLALSIKYLENDFNTNIIIGEQKNRVFEKMFPSCEYICFSDMEKFHRTKMLNQMAQMAKTPIVVNWDADVFVPTLQIIRAVNLIREQKADMVYPYDGRFARVPRHFQPEMQKRLDLGIFRNENFKGTRPEDDLSVGGAIIWNKQSFIDGGQENEYMISYAPEDIERYERFRRLRFNIVRIPGIIYHLDHYVGENSSMSHPLFKSNWNEMDKIRAMSDDELKVYIKTWPWYKIYHAEYYEQISTSAIVSRDNVFYVLDQTYPDIMKNIKTLIDVGCGIGEWGFKMDEKYKIEYYGVDYNLPKNKILIPAERYRNYDLTSKQPFPFQQKFDMAICLEVYEHLPENSAEHAVNLLCDLADVVLFGAAIPAQGGLHHENEQWQTYWQELFNNRGYYSVNVELKDVLFNNTDVEIWYRQNMVLYVNTQKINHPTTIIKDFVHPKMYTNIVGTHTNWKNIKPYTNDTANAARYSISNR